MKEVLKESIKMHYDNKDYTEVVRDAILCLMNEIRKKSDLQDNDGIDLINKAFSEKNPLIKINKMQTQTELNKHRGLTDLSKGLIEYFRNPMSHAKQSYSKEVADAILILIDKVILEEIMQSKSLNSIEDWYLEITSDLCPNTERYAQSLVDSIPKNKRYELVVQLYKNRKKVKNEKKYTIIAELLNKLDEDEFSEYCSIIESDIFVESKEEDFIDILTYVSKDVWDKFANLSKIKIEDIVLEDITKCEVYYTDNGFDFDMIQENGNIIVSAKHLIKFFSNKKEIVECIYEKLINSRDNEFCFDFLIENFFELIAQEKVPDYDIINCVNYRIRCSSEPIWQSSFKKKLKTLPASNPWYKMFFEAFNAFNTEDDDLPF